MISLIRKICNYLLDVTENKKGFEVDCERCVEITDKNAFNKNCSGYIYFRLPTSQEKRDWKFYELRKSESSLKKLKDEAIDTEKLYQIVMEEKIIPFAEKVITKVKGYKKNGKEMGLEYVKKYYESHLEIVCQAAFGENATGKKKDLT